MKRLLWKVWASVALLALLPGAALGAGPDKTPGAGPIRLVWFTFVQGDVSWRAGDGAVWSPALVHLPLRQGAQIRVAGDGRAEVQFDDGSLLRLGRGAEATLETLYSDEGGEMTELDLPEGVTSLELRGTPSVYQIDTPFVSVKSEGPAKVRVGVDSSVAIAVRLGDAAVEGGGAKITLHSGDYLNVPDKSSPVDVSLLPDEDSWDRFSDDRDRQLADAESAAHLPPDLARVAGNLDAYGTWHNDPRYGAVWCPRETDANWRPYLHGQWVWTEPFGWTWMSAEAWGWAPYHYGTWVREPYGWAWVPGPAQQYWCPAVVGFSEGDGEVAWVPLAPGEVHYPVYLAHCYDGGDWADFFSIGGAAVYYPDDDFSCDPCPFSNGAVNRGTAAAPSIPTLVRRPVVGTLVNRYLYSLPGIRPQPAGFVPVNACRVSGATAARTSEFGGGGRYRLLAADGGVFWTRGRSVEVPMAGLTPVSGPRSVRPVALSRSSSSGSALGASSRPRPVFRAPLPDRAARLAPPQPQAPARFIPPVFVRPAASGEALQTAQQNRPEAGQSASPVPARQADAGRIWIVLPRETPQPRDNPRRDEAASTGTVVSRAESQPGRPAPRPEERPQEQRPQEQRPQEQRSPPPADKPDSKPDTQDSKTDDKGGRGK